MPRRKQYPGQPDPKDLKRLTKARTQDPFVPTPEIIEGIAKAKAKLDKLRAKFSDDETFYEHIRKQNERLFKRFR